jgi:hypothetical protein
MILAMNEDGSLPGEPLPFFDAFLWFFITPVGIFLLIWILVLASESLKKSKQSRKSEDLLTRIGD